MEVIMFMNNYSIRPEDTRFSSLTFILKLKINKKKKISYPYYENQ